VNGAFHKMMENASRTLAAHLAAERAKVIRPVIEKYLGAEAVAEICARGILPVYTEGFMVMNGLRFEHQVVSIDTFRKVEWFVVYRDGKEVESVPVPVFNPVDILESTQKPKVAP
jgi:hypothetical protein